MNNYYVDGETVIVGLANERSGISFEAIRMLKETGLDIYYVWFISSEMDVFYHS